MQHDHQGRDRVVYYQSRQPKPDERNYPVHDKEYLAMKYALAMFRVYLLGRKPFVVFTDHASLLQTWKIECRGRCAVASTLHKTDANAIGVVRTSTPSSSLLDDVRSAYANDADAKQLLVYFAAPMTSLVRGWQNTSVPLKLRITNEYHDAPTSGHPGREKTYLLLTRDFYWSHPYKWVRKYLRACEVCQRVKPAPLSQAPLRSLPTPSECWQSISMDFIFGLPPDNKWRTGIVVFVDRFTKMVHLAAVPTEMTSKQTARLFVEMVFRHHGMPIDIISDRDPRFTVRFCQEMFTLRNTQLSTSRTDHPQTGGQTERVNRVLVDALRSYAHSFRHWSDCQPMAELASNNLVHVSIGHTPFSVNATRHPRVPNVLGAVAPFLSGGGYPVLPKPNEHADTSTISVVSTRARSARSPSKESTMSAPGVDTLDTGRASEPGGPDPWRLPVASIPTARRTGGPQSGGDFTPSGVEASRTGPVRDPWMPNPSEIKSRFGSTAPPGQYALYLCSGIKDEDVTKELDFDPATGQRRDYYIGLFNELRWYGNKETSRRSSVPEWQALCQSWGAFVEHFNSNPAGCRERVRLVRERYEHFSQRSKIERLHWAALEAGIPCAVLIGIACEHCHAGAVRVSERDINGYTGVRVPEELKALRPSLIAQMSSSAGSGRSAPSRTVVAYSSRPSFTPFGDFGGGGLRTPSPFLDRPASGRSAAPTYRGSEEILTNEYENDPDLGSGYDDQQFAGGSSELLDNGPASASGLSLPLRERFEPEASESSSRGRRDPTLGSTRVDDDVPSSSSFPSSMSASLLTSNRASSSSRASTMLPRVFL
ncbi:unnamed protein product [Phytophthora fragariaefolia]|uniref:Unnamed protein product n=1 Tax=Phytophthora fragariaefolia TaxID=1490495 RepID=A0A9W6Y7I3_9STRA|nr:unnamed protein product [Phytophthora fragariaefolia]